MSVKLCGATHMDRLLLICVVQALFTVLTTNHMTLFLVIFRPPPPDDAIFGIKLVVNYRVMTHLTRRCPQRHVICGRSLLIAAIYTGG